MLGLLCDRIILESVLTFVFNLMALRLIRLEQIRPFLKNIRYFLYAENFPDLASRQMQLLVLTSNLARARAIDGNTELSSR